MSLLPWNNKLLKSRFEGGQKSKEYVWNSTRDTQPTRGGVVTVQQSYHPGSPVQLYNSAAEFCSPGLRSGSCSATSHTARNMALHGDRTLAELHKKHICHIGNTVYNISPLLTPQNNVRRDVYLENVREKMVLVQICPTCNNGPCDPDSHKFQESEYQVPDESQNFTAAMASLLSQSGFSPAFTSGGTNFLGGESSGWPKQFLAFLVPKKCPNIYFF